MAHGVNSAHARGSESASLLGRIIAKFDDRSDLAPWVQHHVPGEIGDLAGAQACFDRQENDDDVSLRVSAVGGVDEEVLYVSMPACLP